MVVEVRGGRPLTPHSASAAVQRGRTGLWVGALPSQHRIRHGRTRRCFGHLYPENKKAHEDHGLFAAWQPQVRWWAMLGLNQRPLPCEAKFLTCMLIYIGFHK